MADINKTVVPADAFSTVDHDEYAAAEAQAKESVGNYTLKLKRPFTYEGQTFDELNFDFEGLTGDDALAIEDELQAIGKPTISPTFSVAPAAPSNGSGEYAVRYWATYIDGKKVREVDQLNFICYVNGTDYLADVRKALGM